MYALFSYHIIFHHHVLKSPSTVSFAVISFLFAYKAASSFLLPVNLVYCILPKKHLPLHYKEIKKKFLFSKTNTENPSRNDDTQIIISKAPRRFLRRIGYFIVHSFLPDECKRSYRISLFCCNNVLPCVLKTFEHTY